MFSRAAPSHPARQAREADRLIGEGEHGQRSRLRCFDLDEVRESVDDPDAPAARLRRIGRSPAYQRVLDPSFLLDLNDHRVLARADPQPAGATTVANAVGRQLVGDEDEVVLASFGQT